MPLGHELHRRVLGPGLQRGIAGRRPAFRCDLVGHANGGTTSLPDDHLDKLFDAPGAQQRGQAAGVLVPWPIDAKRPVVEIHASNSQLGRLSILAPSVTPSSPGCSGLPGEAVHPECAGETNRADGTP